jgi:hypothetical protein
MKLLLALTITLMTTTWASAQGAFPPETSNAALRYWMAFAELKDPPSDKATQELLGKTAAGEASWDEAKLGPILDFNEDALAIFQRATKLPECDWGVEYGQGPRASIAYAPRARVMARLNTLQGMREMAKGNAQTAVDTWLAGIHFSRDVSRGGTLIFALVAKSALLANLQALSKAARDGKLSAAQKRSVNEVVRALPADGFDWSAAWTLEGSSIELLFKQLQAVPNPKALYESLSGDPAPEVLVIPSLDDMAKFRNYVSRVQDALKLPPPQSAGSLEALQTELRALNPSIQRFVPSAQKVNAARQEIYANRLLLLGALSEK